MGTDLALFPLIPPLTPWSKPYAKRLSFLLKNFVAPHRNPAILFGVSPWEGGKICLIPQTDNRGFPGFPLGTWLASSGVRNPHHDACKRHPAD
jgi:hypothetical protein